MPSKTVSRTQQAKPVGAPSTFALKYTVDVKSSYIPKSGDGDLIKHPDRFIRSGLDFFQLAKTWDMAPRSLRERILDEFIKSNKNKTAPQLEVELGLGASLFLTRITAWLRLTYLLGYNLALQIQAIDTFVSSAGGSQYLNEFLEVGGVFTLLEIVGLAQCKEADKTEAIKLLSQIAGRGRKFKEFICECFGIKAVAECLAKSRSETTQEQAKKLLLLIGTGNQKYLVQVYKALLSLITNNNIPTQNLQLSCQALRALLPGINPIHPSIIDATMTLLRNPYFEVQFEGCELLKDLVKRANLQEIVLTQLVSRLKTVSDTTNETINAYGGAQQATLKKDANLMGRNEGSASVYAQQACSAKLLGVMAATSKDLADRMIQLQCVSGLLSALANVASPDSQMYAADTLIYLITQNSALGDAIRDNVGQDFYDNMLSKPDTFYRELSKDQIRFLNRNNIRIRRHGRGGEDEDDDFDVESEEERDDDEDRDQEETEADKKEDTKKMLEATNVESFSKPSQENTEVDPLDDIKNVNNTTVTGKGQSGVKGSTLYIPYAIANIQTSLTGNRYSGENEEDNNDIYEQDYQVVKESKKASALVPLSDRKPEYPLEMDMEQDSRMAHAKVPGLFKPDASLLRKDNAVDVEEVDADEN